MCDFPDIFYLLLCCTASVKFHDNITLKVKCVLNVTHGKQCQNDVNGSKDNFLWHYNEKRF